MSYHKQQFADWRIGTLTYIDEYRIQLRSTTEELHDRLFKGSVQSINALNQYVFAYNDMQSQTLFRVMSIGEAEKPYSHDETAKTAREFTITALPIGEIRNDHYQAGVTHLPMVGSNIYACTDEDLHHIFRGSPTDGEEIGSLLGYASIRPNISLDRLLRGHTAILGNTGSGKSTTARLILHKLADQFISVHPPINEKARFIVFDLHGDYSSFQETASSTIRYIANDEYHLCPGDLSIDDWTSILKPSQRIQRPLLERALMYSKLNSDGRNYLYRYFALKAIRNPIVDSHASRQFLIDKYAMKITDFPDNDAERFRKELEQYELKFGNVDKVVIHDLEQLLLCGLPNEYRTGATTSIQSMLSDQSLREDSNKITIENIEESLNFVFAEEIIDGNRQARSYSEGLVTQIHNLRTRYSSNLFDIQRGKSILEVLNNSGLTFIDVCQVHDDDGLKLLSSFAARHVFEENQGEELADIKPTRLVFDEAHRYIRENDLADDSIFNRIAREGRKFGVSIVAISQIPSELSKVILSQTSAFIIHRIQNSADLEYIRMNVPAISQSQVRRLPMYTPGSCIILGNAIPLPMEIQVDDTYSNETPDISIYNITETE